MSAPNPWLLTPKGLFVYPDTGAARWCKTNLTDPRTVAIWSQIANVPQALWLGPDASPAWIAGYVGAAKAASQLPVISLYAIPNRDLNGFSAGGVPNADAYRAFVDKVVGAVGLAPCIVHIEADSLTHCIGQDEDFVEQRVELLQYAVEQFALHCPTAWCYLDAGDANYMTVSMVAPLLAEAGVGMAAGFALNCSQFQSTTKCKTFAVNLNKRLATYGIPARQVLIDVSRTGAAIPQSYIDAHQATWWCNPAPARLGQPPTMTGLVWLKGPGVSDGPDGVVTGVPSGAFDPRLAMNLLGGASTPRNAVEVPSA